MKRKHVISWGIVGVFLLQLALLALSFGDTVGMTADLGIVSKVVANEAILVNETIEFLLPVGLRSEDWWLGLLAMPVVYYGTAVVVAALGRSVGRFGRRRLG